MFLRKSESRDVGRRMRKRHLLLGGSWSDQCRPEFSDQLSDRPLDSLANSVLTEQVTEQKTKYDCHPEFRSNT